MAKLQFVRLLIVTCLLSGVLPAQPTSWTARGIGGGGAVQHPAISPHDPNRVFLSCDMSQMLETTDFGTTWTTMDFRNLAGSLRGRVLYTNDPQLLYALSLTSSGAAVPMKSTDGGTLWAPMSPNPCTNNGAFQMYVNPNDGQQFVVSDRIKIYFTRDGGSNYSTLDTDNSVPGIHLAGAFFEGSNIYIASNKKFFTSTDGGLSFATAVAHSALGIQATEGVASFTGAKEGGTTKLFCTTITAATLTCKTFGSDVNNFVGLYAMTNPFTAWQNITTPFNAATPDAERAYFVRMLPNDIDTLYLGGNITIGANTKYGTVYKSTDGGANWVNLFLDNAIANANTDITTGWLGHSSTANYAHSWIGINTTEGMCIDPHDINRIITSDKSNLHYSLDGGATWTQMYVNPADANPANQSFPATRQYASTGLETTVTYWMAWVDSLHLITALADLTAIQSSDGGVKWGFDYDPTNVVAGPPQRLNDISIIEKNPTNGTLYAGVGDVVGSNGVWDDSRLSQSMGRLCLSSDGGASWQIMHDFGRPVTFLHFPAGQSDTLYACVQSIEGDATGGIYRCDDVNAGSASVWTQLPMPARASHRPSSVFRANGDTLIASFYPFDSTGGYTYAARSGVFVSEDGGTTWIDRSDPAMLQKTYRLVPDRNDATGQVWFACVGAGGPQNSEGLYRTTNRGQSWTNVMQGVSTSSVTFHPTLPDEMYICTEFSGLYYATQTNSFNPSTNSLLNFPFRNPQRVFFNPYDENEVWVTSFGNGLYVGHTQPVAHAAAPQPAGPLRVHPNPSHGEVKVEWPGNEILSVTVMDVQGRTLKQVPNEEVSLGELPAGVYLLLVRNGAAQACTRVLKW